MWGVKGESGGEEQWNHLQCTSASASTSATINTSTYTHTSTHTSIRTTVSIRTCIIVGRERWLVLVTQRRHFFIIVRRVENEITRGRLTVTVERDG
jgi:hypothetical protein